MQESTNKQNNKEKDENTVIIDSLKVLDEKNTKKQIAPDTTISSPVQNLPAQQNVGFFRNMWNKMKSWWVIEEEEYIDAHGFKAKRPKKKIPLRKQGTAIYKDSRLVGGEGLAYASLHSPFGKMFL